jgi:hypothetical protein
MDAAIFATDLLTDESPPTRILGIKSLLSMAYGVGDAAKSSLQRSYPQNPGNKGLTGVFGFFLSFSYRIAILADKEALHFSFEFFLEKRRRMGPLPGSEGWFLRLRPYYDCAPGEENFPQSSKSAGQIGGGWSTRGGAARLVAQAEIFFCIFAELMPIVSLNGTEGIFSPTGQAATSRCGSPVAKE